MTKDEGETFEVLVNRRKKLTSFPYRAIEVFCRSASEKGIGDLNHVVDLEVPGCRFYKLPHSNGEAANVGNPICKAMIRHLESGQMSSEHREHGQTIASKAKRGTYWMGNRDRILNQLTVWLAGEGAILPQVVPAGTVTRRAVEKTWMTASNPKPDRIGSELKSMIQAPSGFCFVGADVDSQEQWIAALFGDWHIGKGRAKGQAGITPFSRMVLMGNKADGSDQHSVVARQIGITRDQAKILNYGRLYGAGLPFATLLLKNWQPTKDATEIEEMAKKLYDFTKGKRSPKIYFDTNYQHLLETSNLSNAGHSPTGLKRKLISWLGGRPLPAPLQSPEDLFYSILRKGTESDTFNCLEAVVRASEPRTPVLDCQISRSLSVPGSHYLPSRINWVVQSSAVDFLHLLLTSMQRLCREFQIDARFAISIHDEIRYLVRWEDRFRCALALQYSNLLTRAMFSFRCGIHNLPQSVAFFSQVEIDQVLRKEPDLDCTTPSNPKGLQEGYGIQNGVSLTMDDILEATGGTLKRGKDSC